MGKNSAVIDKLVIDIYMDDDHSEKATDLLNSLAKKIKTEVLPRVEKQITDSGLTAKDLTIDRLDLDISAIMKGSWKEKLAEKIAQEIILAGGQILATEPQSAEQSKRSRTLQDLWVFYLRYGVLPNWKSELQIQSLKDLMERFGEEIRVEDAAMQLRTTLQQDLRAFTRFIFIANDQSIDALIQEKVTNDVAKFIRASITVREEWTEFRKILVTLLHRALYESGAWEITQEEKVEELEKALEWLSKTNTSIVTNHKNAIERLQNAVEKFRSSKTNKESSDAVIRRESSEKIKSFKDADLRTLIIQLLESDTLNAQQKMRIATFVLQASENEDIWERFLNTVPELMHSKQDQEALLQRMKGLQPEVVSNRLKTEIESEIRKELERWKLDTLPKEEIALDNAGVVLLKPFIPQFLSNLSLLAPNNEWKSDANKVEGMYALHYLATGNFDPTEDQLYLSKLLFGWDMEEIVAKPLTILGVKIEELDAGHSAIDSEKEQLLTIIRENWRPMRNTSWERLQHEFLSRSGKLVQTDEKVFELRLEEHAMDIMLPFKKWGIGMIRYSWMDTTINVEWKS